MKWKIWIVLQAAKA